MTLVLVMVGVLASCTGSDKSPQANKGPQVGTLTASQQLAAAKVRVDAATSLHLTLSSSDIPASVDGALGADGSGTHAPAFKGTLDVRVSGFEDTVDVVAIQGLVYVKPSFSGDFIKVDPKTYHAPDPAQLFASEGGISSLLTDTTNPVKGKKIRVGPDSVQIITGTLPGTSVARLLSIGDATKSFDVTYGIVESGGELRSVAMTGPFYPGATSTYTLTLDKYGAPVKISKP